MNKHGCKKEGPPQPVLYHSWFWSGTHMSLIYNHIWLLADLPDRKGDAGNHSSRTDLRSGRVHMNLIYNHIWFWVLGPLESEQAQMEDRWRQDLAQIALCSRSRTRDLTTQWSALPRGSANPTGI